MTRTNKTGIIGLNIGTNIGNIHPSFERRIRYASLWDLKEMMAGFKKSALKSHSFSGSETKSSANLVNEVVEKIEIGILFGEYRPREHLVQDQLAERYGAERNVIRAALKKLEERSVIEHFPNRGSMVKEMTLKNAKDLYQLRFLLESNASRVAVAHITRPILFRLETLHREMKNDLKRGELRGFTLAHEKFHQIIFETADNSYLLKAIKDLRSASASIRNFSYSRYSLSDTKSQLFDEHWQMIKFMEKGKVEEVGELSLNHIKAGLNHYLRNFFPQEPEVD